MIATSPPPGGLAARPRALTERLPVATLGLLALAVLFLYPTLETGYTSEDVVYSLVPGELQVRGLSLADRALEWAGEVIRMGRFAPLNPMLQITVHGLMPDLRMYKAVLLVAVLVDLILFHALVRRVARDPGFALLAGTLAIGLWQLRVFNDAILSYHTQMQVVTAGVLGSLLALQVALDTGRRRWLVVSVLALLVGALVYEIAYPLVAIHLLLIARARPRWGDRLRLGAPFVATVGGLAATTLALRRIYPLEHYLPEPEFASSGFLAGAWHQVQAALPLSYRWSDPHQVLRHLLRPGAWWPRLERGATPLVLGIAFGLSLLALGRRARPDLAAPGPEDSPAPPPARVEVGFLAVVGLLLAVLPAMMMALSPRHRDLTALPGLGWLQIYTQSFGVALVLAALVWALAGTGRGRGATGRASGLALAVALLVGLTYQTNVAVCLLFHAPEGTTWYSAASTSQMASWHYQRQNLEAALQAGLLDAVPEGSTLVLAHEYPGWHHTRTGQFFYAMHAGRRLLLEPPAAPERPAWTLTYPPPPNHPIPPSGSEPSRYRLRDVAHSRFGGLVVLEPLAGPGAAEPPRLFVRDPRLATAAGAATARIVSARDPARGFVLADLPPIAAGPDWRLVRLDPAADPLDLATLALEVPAPGPRAGARASAAR